MSIRKGAVVPRLQQGALEMGGSRSKLNPFLRTVGESCSQDHLCMCRVSPGEAVTAVQFEHGYAGGRKRG
jgi:hypothetical protein